MAFTSNVANSLTSHPEVWAHMQAPSILLVSHANLSSTCWHLCFFAREVSTSARAQASKAFGRSLTIPTGRTILVGRA